MRGSVLVVEDCLDCLDCRAQKAQTVGMDEVAEAAAQET